MNVKTKEAGLTGNLQTVSLSDLLQLISAAGKTGMLFISRDDQKREIYFMKGSIIYATSFGSEDELLGNLVLRRRKILKPDLKRALTLQKLGQKRLGTILLEMRVLTKEELIECLQYQIEEIIYNLFGWNSGEFIFFEGRLPPADQITTQLNTMNVIMEGSRRIDEWIQVQQTLPADDVKLQMVKNLKIKSSTVTMPVNDLQLLPFIDGERTIPELLRVSPLSEFNTRKALYNMITSGLVEAGEKKKTIKQKTDVEKLLPEVVIRLYSQSYQTIEKMASRKLGEGAKKILKRCFDAQKSFNPILANLESSENFLDFRHLESSSEKIPQPIRFHKLMDGFNDLLLEFLGAISRSLGKNLTRQVISQIKKEVAPVVAEKRWIAKEYELEEELLKTLKKSLRCL
ncbi:MAG: DUF4388 domain-containing protein [candidate division Zixibacteria bacterium]|nr:DUF4388 domain-containing protein [candidate division Zixibacteria bacterium]